MFLLKLVEFIELEINKFQYNEGIFTVLANKGYYDATVDRILQAFNDLIFINDNNQGHNRNIYDFYIYSIKLKKLKRFM